MCAQERQQDQTQRRCQVNHNQQFENKARPFSQRITEGFGGGRYPFVYGKNLRLPMRNIRIGCLIGLNRRVHFIRQLVELNQVAIADGPLFDRGVQIAEITEVTIEPDDARHVFRAIAPIKNASASGGQIWRGLVHGDTQVMPALRHLYGLPVFFENPLVTAIGIQAQVVNGIFLALGP